MRLPEDKIKEAILHPEVRLRIRAINYFAKAYSPDPSVMPLVIRAVETHGRQDAYQLIGQARDLRQSEDTVAWVIAELNNPQSDTYDNYAYNLAMVLLHTDPALLLPRESAVLEARHFPPDLRGAFTERLRMHAWDEAACWRELEAFCENSKSAEDAGSVDTGHAHRVVEALARYGNNREEKVRNILAWKGDEDSDHPLAWLQPFVAQLAGLARLESAIPLLVDRLLDDGGDILNEECAEALTRIGTPAVLEAVARSYPGAPDHFRLYAVNPLEHIHTDLAVETMLQLLAGETDEDTRTNLAQALLSQFADEGIEAARQILLSGRPLGFVGQGMRGVLLDTATIMDRRFPEYDEWLAAEKAATEAHLKVVEKFKDNPQALMLYALEKLAGMKGVDVARASRPVLPPPPPPLLLPRKPVAKTTVGRNDPCPCGSGKKFKNCCLRK